MRQRKMMKKEGKKEKILEMNHREKRKKKSSKAVPRRSYVSRHNDDRQRGIRLKEKANKQNIRTRTGTRTGGFM